MSQWNSRETAPYNARDAVKRFTARGINLPEGVATAVTTVERIKAAAPAQPDTAALRRLIVDGASQADIDAALLADIGHTRLAVEYRQGEIDAARAVLAAFRDSHDALFPQLAKQAAVKIAHLEKVAALGDVNLDQLVRDRRVADAQALAEVDTAAAELNELYELRNFLVSGGYLAMVTDDGTNCSRWRDPRPVNRAARGADTQTQHFLRGLRKGGELWFPTATEARAAAQPLAAEHRRNADELAATRRAQGHLVAFN